GDLIGLRADFLQELERTGHRFSRLILETRPQAVPTVKDETGDSGSFGIKGRCGNPSPGRTRSHVEYCAARAKSSREVLLAEEVLTAGRANKMRLDKGSHPAQGVAPCLQPIDISIAFSREVDTGS